MSKKSLFVYIFFCWPILVYCQNKCGDILNHEIDSILILEEEMPGGTTAMVYSSVQSIDWSKVSFRKLNENDLTLFKNALQRKKKRLFQQKYGMVKYGMVYVGETKHVCIFYSNKDSFSIHDITCMRRYFFKPQEMSNVKEMLKI